MSNAVDESTGATFVMGTTAWAVRLTGIDLTDESVTPLKTSHLGTTGHHTYMPSDVKEPIKVDLQIFYDPNEPPPTGVTQTGTITYPVPSGSTNGATCASSGFLVSSGASIKIGELMTGQFTFQGSGAPTRADAT